jgi:hypothetical protein
MFTNEIRPYKSHADHRKQTCDTHSVTQVGVLDVEARRFHGTECRFNLPAFFIGRYSIFRSIETDQDLKFGYPVRVFDSTSCKIDILPFMQKELVVEFLLSDFKGIEEPPRSDSFSCGGLDNPNILPNTDIVSNPVVVKPSNPLLADDSRSATRQSMQSCPKSRMNRSMISLRSSQLELPRLFKRLNSNGKATPL